ncbi:hypothetical protein F3Y22_tig00117048pilonHSYRG01475 [Hibiscus syriacus]|uniref:RNA-dependent RNA polymerase n=1 Tax=Hibiscus syriacus TaxID=106335 RepID=A0A6A2X8D6_HIBSY|nr:hypothetical protein F3Y22_tig00117048pilonHSYRG01475 [Hibiscus syriacus]
MMSSPGGGSVSIASTSATVTPTRSFSANGGGELEFCKAFVILSNIGQNRLEEVILADTIRSYKNLAMDEFERKVWDSLGKHYTAADRVKSLEWESGKTYEYHCHVNENGGCMFKGPYFEKARSHLQRVIGDDNVLSVKFEKDGKSSVDSGSDEFKKVAKEGILVVLLRYRFFVFKDGGKAAKKKDRTTSSVKCLFVRFESHTSVDEGKEYVLSAKTVQVARSMFMHVHNLPRMAKYMARFSLILSKSMKLEVDLANINFMEIEDISCKEYLALKCPRNVYKGSIAGVANVEIGPIVALMGEASDMKSTEFHHRVLPLLLQIRFFYNGYAIKGTVLVNKKLPPQTIQVRDSMNKVRPDPNLSNICTRNSLEVVATSLVKTTFAGDKRSRNKTEVESSAVGTTTESAMTRGTEASHLSFQLTSHKVNGKNYLEWSQSVKLAINGHGKLGNLTGEVKQPQVGDPKSMGKPFLFLLTSRVKWPHLQPFEPVIVAQISLPAVVKITHTVISQFAIEGDFFMDILKNALEGSQGAFSNKEQLLKLDEYVGHAKYAIFFPYKGPRSLADEIAGGDFDGDMFFVVLQLLDYFKASEPWVEKCSTPERPSPLPSDLSDEELEGELFDSFLRIRFHPSYAMSAAANNWCAIMDWFLTVQDSSEKELMKKNLECLINLYYEALDASKTGKKVEAQQELRVALFPHYMERDNSFKSTSILGKIYYYVKSYQEKFKSCFEVGVVEECCEKWTALYEEYRKDMQGALNFPDKDQRNAAANAVYDDFGALELEGRQRAMDEIRNEAIAIYIICYDYAMKTDDACKVTGSALLNLNASQRAENMQFDAFKIIEMGSHKKLISTKNDHCAQLAKLQRQFTCDDNGQNPDTSFLRSEESVQSMQSAPKSTPAFSDTPLPVIETPKPVSHLPPSFHRLLSLNSPEWKHGLIGSLAAIAFDEGLTIAAWFDEKNSSGTLCSLSNQASRVKKLVADRISMFVATLAVAISMIIGLIVAWKLAIVMIAVQPLTILYKTIRLYDEAHEEPKKEASKKSGMSLMLTIYDMGFGVLAWSIRPREERAPVSKVRRDKRKDELKKVDFAHPSRWCRHKRTRRPLVPENIIFGKLNASENEVMEAARVANALEFISSSRSTGSNHDRKDHNCDSSSAKHDQNVDSIAFIADEIVVEQGTYALLINQKGPFSKLAILQT